MTVPPGNKQRKRSLIHAIRTVCSGFRYIFIPRKRAIPLRISSIWKPVVLALTLTAALATGAAGADKTPAAGGATTAKPHANPAGDPAVAAPRDAKWVKRHEGYLEEAKKGPYDVIFLGDSITDGWHGGGRAIFTQCYAPLHTLNLGIGGDRTEHVLWRLDNGEVDGLKPKVVVLMIGTNNSGNTAEAITRGVTAVVKDLRTKLPEAKILLLAIFPRGAEANTPIREKLATVNTAIAKLDDGSHVKYLDIGKAFLNDSGAITKDVMRDFLHPSTYGYVLWAKAMNPTLAEMLGEKITEPTLPPPAPEKAAAKPASKTK